MFSRCKNFETIFLTQAEVGLQNENLELLVRPEFIKLTKFTQSSFRVEKLPSVPIL